MSINVGFGKSKSKSTTTQVSQLTPAPESDMQRRIREANEAGALDQATGFQDILRRTTGELGPEDAALLGSSRDQLLAAIQHGGISLSPQAQAAFDQIFGNEADELQRRLREQATQIANTRGLALSDSPIANPLLAETQRGLVGLGTQRARGLLDFGQAGFDRLLALRQFQNGLQQQAFANRVGLLGGTPGSVPFQRGNEEFRLATGVQRGTETTRGSKTQFGVSGAFSIPGTSSFQPPVK